MWSVKTLNYRGFSSPIDYDDECALFLVRIHGLPNARPIRAGNLSSLRYAFEREVDLHVGGVDRHGQDAAPGQSLICIDSAVHAQCAMAAQAAGLSLPVWVERTLRDAAERRLGDIGAKLGPRAATR